MEKSNQPRVLNFAFEDIQFSEKDIFHLMGYSEQSQLPEPMAISLEMALKEAPNYFDIQGGYIITEDIQVDQEKKRILSHDQIFESKQIVTHQLRRSESFAWFLCTAGARVSAVSQNLQESGDMLGSYMIDILANVVVDAAMDKVQEALKVALEPEGLKITNRYSPGYCSWDIAEQQKLFKVFPEGFLGVRLTESSLMVPIKSISGVIGIGQEVKYNDYTCNLCDDVNCLYRNLRTRS